MLKPDLCRVKEVNVRDKCSQELRPSGPEKDYKFTSCAYNPPFYRDVHIN